jgi:hypothetical protein
MRRCISAAIVDSSCPRFVAGINVFKVEQEQNVDGRDKPGHDGILHDAMGLVRNCDAVPA